MPIKHVEFQNSEGHVLTGVLRYPDSVEERKLPAIVLLHGFNENMNREWISSLANFISPYGFVVLRFDFHGHGESQGEFEEHTITQQIDDIKSAIDFIETQSVVDVSRICVIGHGIGGSLGVIAAEKDLRIKKLVLWSARHDLQRHIESKFSEHELKELHTKGQYSHGMFDLNKTYIDSIKEHSVKEALVQLRIPLLIIQGTDDLQVSIEEARTLYRVANEPKQLELIDGADHWFRDEDSREKLFEIIIGWLNKYSIT